MAFIHSCFTETNNHSPALFQINTGMSRMGFPCVGAWVTYGLGSESARTCRRSSPCTTPSAAVCPRATPRTGAPASCPASTRAPPSTRRARPSTTSTAPPTWPTTASAVSSTSSNSSISQHQQEHPGEAELSARIESFELAYRMQMAAPEALDLNREAEPVRQMYGLDDPKCRHFARQCLMARRLVERGVRFVQIYSGGMENERSWDGHTDIAANHRQFAGETDTPIAALLTDLKPRGLLDSTLVIWGGEFGRLPVAQRPSGGKQTGRDHNPHAFTSWLAGGGVKGGVHHGATDEIGHKAAVDRVSVNDLHATILHLLGLDHKRLTYRYNGRSFRLTDVAGEVVRSVLA